MDYYALTVSVLLAIGNLISEFLLTRKVPFLFSNPIIDFQYLWKALFQNKDWRLYYSLLKLSNTYLPFSIQ